mgnify:FL=1
MKFIKIPELNIEITRELYNIGVPFSKIKIPPGFRIPTIDEHLFLADNNPIFRQSYEYVSNNHDEGKIIAVFPECLAYYADYFEIMCSKNGVRFVKNL